jgi:hypothetical protein
MSKLPNNRFASVNRLLKRNTVSPPGKTGGGTLPSPRSSCKYLSGKIWRSDRIKMSRLTLPNGFEFTSLSSRFDFCDHCNAPTSQLTRTAPPNASRENPLWRISFHANNLLHRPSTLKTSDQSNSIKESEFRKIPRSLFGRRDHFGRGDAIITDKRQ